MTEEGDHYDNYCTHSYLESKGITPNADYIKYRLATHEPVYHRDHLDRQAASTNTSVSALRHQNASLLAKLHIPHKEAAEEEMRAHMQRLHEYNELKDVGQAMIGRLAVLRETTTRALYPEFGLDLDD